MRRPGTVVVPRASRARRAGASSALLTAALVLAALLGVVRLAEPEPGEGSRPVVAGIALVRETAAAGLPPDPALLPLRLAGSSPSTGAAAPVEEELPPPAPRLRRGLAASAVDLVDAVVAHLPATVLGIAVLDRSTGERAAGAGAPVPQYSASLAKLIVAVDVLHQRRTGVVVTDADLALVRRALGPSDDVAMSTLWSRFDGVGAVQRVADRVGLPGTSPPEDPSQWGETLVSADDLVTLYDHVLTDLPAEDRDLLLAALGAAPPTAADGFDQSFGLLSGGAASGVAVKQAWMCCLAGQIQMHSAGTVGPDQRFVVALLTSQPRWVGFGGARGALDVLADAARAALR